MIDFLIPEDSPLRNPPPELSRKQVLILDGIRYAAEMAHIAYERLFAKLQDISLGSDEPKTRVSVEAMMDAWTIVDSAHRFRDMIEGLPGLKKHPWKRILQDQTKDVAELRDCVQHLLGEIDGLIENGGQLWGYLTWAQIRNGQYTGKWLMLSGGSNYVGDKWYIAGPMELPFPVPPGRIRLNAFGHQVYLGRTVEALKLAVTKLTEEILNDGLRPHGSPAVDWRGADMVIEQSIEVMRTPK